MADNEWLDFPGFDVARWEAEASNIQSADNGVWHKPRWTRSANSIELPAKAVAAKEEGNAWSLTQSIARAEDVMPALLGGAEGIRFQYELCTWQWMSGVHLEMIHLHLDADWVRLAHFPIDLMLDNGWKGSCTLSVRNVTTEEVRIHANDLSAAPDIRKWAINTCDMAEPVEALCSGLAQAQHALETFKAAGLDPADEFQAFTWLHEIGPHVLEGIAMTRAMRILWQRWLTSSGLERGSIWLDARTYLPKADEGIPTDRLIGMTSAAYASAIGGTDSLEIVPHDAKDKQASADGKRWARNIQHLMREEAGLNRVFDPMGGSHVVEFWTSSLIESVWDTFKNQAQR